MPRIPTLRELAAIAGVSHQTVSLALRNSPKITPATRDRLQKVAKKAGYRRNPSLSAWVAYVRTKKPITERATLAYVAPLPLTYAHQYEFYREFYEGALAEAGFLGYHLDFLALSDYNQNWSRIQRVLKARNIRGCVIFSQFLGGQFSLKLNDYAVVCFDRGKSEVELDFASSDHYKGMTLALENLRRLGYQRIGFYGGVNPHVEDLARWRGAFAADLLRRSCRLRIPIREWEIEAAGSKSILKWWIMYRPDAIISSFGQEIQVLEQAGVRIPEDVAIVKLDVPQSDHFYSGIDQRLPSVAAAAVRLLAEKLERNEVGPPEVCRAIVVQPKWKEGKSAPPVNL